MIKYPDCEQNPEPNQNQVTPSRTRSPEAGVQLVLDGLKPKQQKDRERKVPTAGLPWGWQDDPPGADWGSGPAAGSHSPVWY